MVGNSSIQDNSLNHTLRRRGDYKPEIYFIGQIVGGVDFPTERDGIFVEATLNCGEDWNIINKSGQFMQTHTSYADDEGFFVFAHPFEFSFWCESVQGW